MKGDLHHIERIHLKVKNHSLPFCDVFKNIALASKMQPTFSQIPIKIKNLKWKALPFTSTKLSWIYINGIKSGCDLLNKAPGVWAMQTADFVVKNRFRWHKSTYWSLPPKYTIPEFPIYGCQLFLVEASLAFLPQKSSFQQIWDELLKHPSS